MRFWTKAGAACAVLTLAAYAKPVPDMKFQDLTGHQQTLGQLKGSVAVVNFWATWCGPCKEELPRLSALSEKYKARGVRFVAISADEQKDKAKIEPYLKGHPVALDVWTGADLDALDRLHLGNVLPATFVMDEKGEIVERIEGEAHDEDVSAGVDWLLGQRAGAAPAAVVKRF
jgi:thiol-disulfide isomerase/thioredoxin